MFIVLTIELFYCKYTTQVIFFIIILEILKSWKIKFEIA
jgi:hypothetical protein